MNPFNKGLQTKAAPYLNILRQTFGCAEPVNICPVMLQEIEHTSTLAIPFSRAPSIGKHFMTNKPTQQAQLFTRVKNITPEVYL
jgi:hypothetical protein